MKTLNCESVTEEFWNKTMNAFVAAFEGRQLSDPALHETTGKLMDPLACSVLADLVKHSRIKLTPDAQISAFDKYPGAHLRIHSGPVLQYLEFGLYLDHWFVQTLLPYIDSIPNVTEEFWGEIGEIAATARTTFDENAPVPARTPEQKQLMKSGRSIHYRIVRNYVLKRSDVDPDIDDDIGFLSSEVPIDEPCETALPKLRKLFSLYYRVLMKLHRPAYQKQRRSG